MFYSSHDNHLNVKGWTHSFLWKSCSGKNVCEENLKPVLTNFDVDAIHSGWDTQVFNSYSQEWPAIDHSAYLTDRRPHITLLLHKSDMELFQTIMSTCAVPSCTAEVMWECNLSLKWHLPKSRSCPQRATSHQAKYFPSAKQKQWSHMPPNFNCDPPIDQCKEDF